jgi:type VI secretion system secreted protein Hcp
VAMQDFHFTIDYGKHSPKIFETCAKGTHIKSAKLTCRKAGGTQQEYLVWKFTDILISSYQTGASSHGGVLPTDQCSFNFSIIEQDYKEQKADGSLGGVTHGGYNLKTNEPV